MNIKKPKQTHTTSSCNGKMFSVKGWEVSAPLKKQTEKHVQASEGASKKEQGKKNLKRKRPDTKDAVKVTDANVEELWDQHIELKAPSSKPPKKKHDQKDKVSKTKSSNAPEKEASQDSKPTASVKPPSKSEEPQHLSRKAKKEARKNLPPTPRSQGQLSKSASIVQPPAPKLTPLQAKMASKLSSARFRHLNEQLYTTPSSTSQSLFTESPDLFEAYHTGFRQQVSVWPSNPVEGFIADVRRRAKNGSLPQRGPGREAKGTCVLADLGCGDGNLAKELVGSKGKKKDEVDGSYFSKLSGGVKIKVHSFDLQSPNEFVFAADIAALPLPSGSVDVAVFCLALMGTNWPSFLDEAWRILRDQGELWVAEIKSRFARAPSTSASKDGGSFKDGTRKKIGDVKKEKEALQAEHEAILEAEIDGASNDYSKSDSTDVSAFMLMLRAHGFELAGSEKESIDLSNKMFVKMRFVKTGRPTSRGKNVGSVTNPGVQEQRFSKQKKRYLDNPEDKIVPEDEEAKILKPCVYKLR